MSDITTDIAQAIIDELLGRGGFDDYWYGIESDVQGEIKQALAAVVREGMRKGGGVEGVKYLDISEFGRLGFLQEVNRKFFHPHGLALEIDCHGANEDDDPYKGAVLSGIWDYRDDPEGMIFGRVDPEKVAQVEEQRRFHRSERRRLFGTEVTTIQPVDWSPEEEDDGPPGDE